MSSPIYMNWRMAEVYKDPSRFRTVVGGRRIGKTEFLVAEALEGAQKPESTTWYVAPTLKQAKAIFWGRLKQACPTGIVSKINESDHWIRFKNRAEIQLHGAENPNALRGKALDKLLLDEGDFIPDSKELYNKVLYPSLMTTKGRVVAVGSPNGFSLLYDFYIRGGGDTGIKETGWNSWLFKTSQFLKPEGHLDPEEYELARLNMDPRSFDQEWNASFLMATGRVCYAWSRDNCKPVEYDKTRDVWVSMDFNVTPAASVLSHVDKDTILQFGEVHMNDAWTEQHALEIMKRLTGHQAHVYVTGDPAGHKRHTNSKVTDWQIVEQVLRTRFGARVHMRAQKEQIPERAKINALNARICNADGSRRYYVNPLRCPQTVLDLEQCTALPDGSIDKKDRARTHWLDGAGYLAHALFPIGGKTPYRNVIVNF